MNYRKKQLQSKQRKFAARKMQTCLMWKKVITVRDSCSQYSNKYVKTKIMVTTSNKLTVTNHKLNVIAFRL